MLRIIARKNLVISKRDKKYVLFKELLVRYLFKTLHNIINLFWLHFETFVILTHLMHNTLIRNTKFKELVAFMFEFFSTNIF